MTIKYNLTKAPINIEDAIEIIKRDIGKCKVGIELERCLVQLKEIIERTKE
jgi:hypothetical protein